MNLSDEVFTTPNSYLFGNTSDIYLMNFYIYNIYSAVFITNFVLGLPVNSYVLWLIYMERGGGVASELFTINLTFGDMVYCLCGLLYVLCFRFPELILFAFYVGGLPIFGRPLFLCLICVERYVAVLFPVTFRKFKPPRYRLTCCAVLWMAILGLSALCISSSPTDRYRLTCVILTLYTLILSIKFFCCFAIVRALKYPGPGQKGNEKKKGNQMKRRAVTAILIMTVTTVLQVSPILLIGLLYHAVSNMFFDLIWCIGYIFAWILGYVHSFFYIHRVGNLPFCSLC